MRESNEGTGRIGISKAHFTPLDVHDVYSRGEIRDLDGRPGPVSGGLFQAPDNPVARSRLKPKTVS